MSLVSRYFRISLVLILTSSMIISCGGKKDLTAEEAGKNLLAAYKPDIATTLALGALIEKSGIKGDVIPWAFRQLMGDYLDYFTKEKKFGISYDGKSLVAMNFKEGDFDNAFFVFNVSDPELFAGTVKVETETEPQEKSGYHYAANEDFSVMIAWYETFGVMIVVNPENTSKEHIETYTEEVMTKAIEKAESAGEYDALYADASDVNTYIKYKFITENRELSEDRDVKEFMERSSELWGNSYSIYSMNFDIDKVTAKIRNHFDADAKAKLDKIPGKGVDKSFMKFLGNENVLGFLTCSLNPDPAMSFLEEMAGEEFTREMDRFETNTGLKKKDWIAGFSGDFSFACTGIKKTTKSYTFTNEEGKEEEYSYTSELPVFNLAIGLNGDLVKNIFDTISAVKKLDGYYSSEDGEGFFIITDQKLIISSDEEQIKYIAANGSFPEFGMRNGLTAMNQSFYGFLDYKKIISIIPEREMVSMSFINDFDYMTASGNLNEMVYEMHLDKTGKNALYLFTKACFDVFLSSPMDDLDINI
jgi:hypothetical protein